MSVRLDQIRPERNPEARALRHFNLAVRFQHGRVLEDFPALEDVRVRWFVDELCYRAVGHGRDKVDTADIDQAPFKRRRVRRHLSVVRRREGADSAGH